MANIEKRNGARSDLNAYFVCVAHHNTPNLLQHLRANKIKFTVDVEPEPPEDQSEDDIFWFESSADIPRIQQLINEVCKKEHERT
jgi:hypothetical protein